MKKGLNKRRSGSGIGWIPAICIPLILVTAALYVFSKLLYGFEYYSPVVTVEGYYELIKSGDYNVAMDMLGIEGDELNDRSRIIDYFKDLYGDKIESVAYAERKLQRTENNVYFDAYVNGKITQKFVLTKTGEKRMRYFDTWTISLIDQIPKTSLTVHAPIGVYIKVNGRDIDETYLTEEPLYVIDKYKNVKDNNKIIETSTYVVKDLIKGYDIEVLSEDNELCELILLEENEAGTVYRVKRNIPAEEIRTMKDIAETITKGYAEFVSNDSKFYNFAPYVYKESKLYDDLKEFYNGWFTKHEDHGFEEVSFFDMEAYDDTHYTLGVEFIFYVHKSGVRHDYPMKYHVYLLKTEDKWLLAELKIEE